jgi:CheY-like chemotaxis protein
MALGVAVDDAILASVTSFLACVNEKSPIATPVEAPSKEVVLPAADLLGVFGVLGHELRNSLAPLANSLHILQIAGTDPSMVEKTRCLMDRQVKVMSRLVDDLMDLPRVARGKVSLKNERIDLNRLVRECAEDRNSGFKESNIELKLQLPDVAIWTVGDVTRLRQVLGNLLSNAIKFTDSGGQVCVSLTPVPALGTAELSVQDNGIGIDPLFLPKIFESFNQADRSMERSRGGLGIGLALVKGLVELHGGRVAVKSEGIGLGTTFTVELPIFDQLQTKAVSDDVAAGSISTSRRVLVIDDNFDRAESTRMILELSGHTVFLAHSGPDGLALARGVLPDVVVCDIGLPGMSGYDVCRELNSEPGLARSLKIALSGHGSSANQEQALNAGFDVFLLKPFDPAQIARVVSRPESKRASQ